MCERMSGTPGKAVGLGSSSVFLSFRSPLFICFRSSLFSKGGLEGGPILYIPLVFELIKPEPRLTILLFEGPQMITGQNIGVVSRQVEQASVVVNVNIHAACARREIEVQPRMIISGPLILGPFLWPAHVRMSGAETIVSKGTFGAQILELTCALDDVSQSCRLEFNIDPKRFVIHEALSTSKASLSVNFLKGLDPFQ